MSNSSFISELAGVFIDEVEDQLQTMEEEILKLEQSGESEETIQTLFRAAHTLKGSSAAMGFEEMKLLTHEMEHILEQVRNGCLSVSSVMINLLFQCLDSLRFLKDEFVNGQGVYTDTTALAAQLHQFGDESSDDRSTSPQPGYDLSMLSMQNLDLQHKAQEAHERGDRVVDIRIFLAPDCLMKSARSLIIHNELRSLGDVLHTSHSFEDLSEDEAAALDAIQFTLAVQADDTDLEKSMLAMMDVSRVEFVPFKMHVPGESAAPVTGDAPVAAAASTTAVKRSQTIRVDVDRLEHLMNLVGELVIDQTRISQVESILNNRYPSDDYVDELAQISDHVSGVISELQESVMKARMLPIEQLFNRFPRMVRDVAQALNKEIELVIEGQETELDRTVIEEIGDPLIHLVRNALDHGIEPADIRIQAGKSPRGRLRIAASHEENQVVIAVEDDGAGIDPNKMRQSAVRKGIITDEEAAGLSDQEAIHLIFKPGFSTASSVSDISGRGVGMDIVRNHIEKLSGVIDIDTQLGAGTRFTIKLPLTLAIITGLLIKLNGNTFILPMSSVVEIVRMPLDAIQTIKGDSVVVVRDQVLPVVWLHDHFQIGRAEQQRKQLPIVVVGTTGKRLALVVDELMGNQEIVVKSLGSYIGKVEGISGATILGDGRVALIIEVAGIGKLANRTKA